MSNNIGMVCKKYYIEHLRNNIINNGSYELYNKNYMETTKDLIKKMKELGNNIYQFHFPHINIFPKMHKNPISFRMVTCGTKAYFKEPNKTLLKILRVIFDKMRKTTYIKNSFDLIKKLTILQSNDFYFKDISSFDFSNLFDNIDLFDLQRVLIILFHQFNIKEICTLKKFNSLISFSLFNVFVHCGSEIYKQKRGVPQGGSISSILCNIYLSYYEDKQTFDDFILYRYIDDVLVVSQILDNYNLSFYPCNLQLVKNKKENEFTQFLDVNIKTSDNRLVYKIFDKKDTFNFPVIKFQHYFSCLHKSVFRNIIVTYLIRMYNLTNNSNDIDNFKNTMIFNLNNLMYDYRLIDICKEFNKSKNL